MKLERFSKVCEDLFFKHFKDIERKVSGGFFLNEQGQKLNLFYPTMILCSEAGGEILSVELLGASEILKPLKVKLRKCKAVSDLTLMDKSFKNLKPMMVVGDDNVLGKLFIGPIDAAKFYNDRRNPVLKNYVSKWGFAGEFTHAFDFSEQFKSALVYDSVMASLNGLFLRAKYISVNVFFRTSLSEQNLRQRLSIYLLRESYGLLGVQLFSNAIHEAWAKGAYLMNLVLSDRIHETIIGDYLNDNPDVLLKSLGYSDIVYEPFLEWLDKTEDNEDQYINPDALLKRDDGYYDICDFKKGLLNKKKITRGERNRRRFLEDVDEGLAQLENYVEYFTYKKNKEHCINKYGAEVHDPKRILIIGNLENTIQIEVEQALRGRPDVMVIDYDTLISSYYASLDTQNAVR